MVRHFCAGVVLALSLSGFAFRIAAAQALDVTVICGGPDESLSEQSKVNLQEEANTLVTSSNVREEAAKQVTRIAVDPRRSDMARELHYIIYISCVIVVSDRIMSTDDKLKRIAEIKEWLQLPREPGKINELSQQVKSPGPAAVRVGNISTPVGGGRWDWSIFVNGTPEEIAKINCVVYHLHPTFPNPDRKVCSPGTDSSKAFQLSSNGWGTFTVAVDLEETNGSINRILYPLTFSPS